MTLLKDYTYLRQMAKFESDVKQAELALERAKRKTAATLVQLQAELSAAESKLEQQKRMMAKIEKNVAEAMILAPSDGIVVYASSARSGGFRGSEEPMREGRTVFEREELIYLPTSNKVKAELKLHESVLDKVRMDMPATVTIDALPGRVFTGRVKKIGLFPDAQMMWMNPDLKVYATEVHLDGDGSELRTGMSCRASIILEEYEDVMYAPVQSVVRIGNQPTVYVMEGSEAKPRPVQIGLDNNRMVHIKSGVEVGERILLAPPLAAAEAEQGRRKPNGETPAVQPEVAPVGPANSTRWSGFRTDWPRGRDSGRTARNSRGTQGTPGGAGGFPRDGIQRPGGAGVSPARMMLPACREPGSVVPAVPAAIVRVFNGLTVPARMALRGAALAAADERLGVTGQRPDGAGPASGPRPEGGSQ